MGYSNLSNHRRRSSRNTGGDQGPSAVPSHPQIPDEVAPVITTAGALEELLAHLYGAGRFAYDSEFIGESTYLPRLCLIQVATEDRVALIDPLANLDLAPFWEFICSPGVEKIVHAGEQDIEPAARLSGGTPANVFDTQIAAGFLNLPYPLSLSKLVMEFVGAKLGKSQTLTQWDLRPLTEEQCGYAADDVRYLPRVRDELGTRLADAGHEAWAHEASQALCEAELYQFDADAQYLRVKGAQSLQPRALAVLRELTVWLDETARAEDVRPRSLVRDEVLTDLAKRPPKTVAELARVRGLPRPVEARYGADLVAAVQRGLSAPQTGLSAGREPEPTPTDRFRADKLWSLAQSICFDQGIDPSLVMNRQDIADLYRLATAGEPVAHLRVLKGWRAKACGERLLKRLADGL